MLRTIRPLVAATVLAALPADAETLRGSARLVEPVEPGEALTLEATVSDVSRADAPSILLAGVSFVTSPQSRYDFAITYDPAALQPQAIYALRVTLSRDDRLVATTDTHIPVLDEDAAAEAVVEVLLRPVN